MMSTTESKWTRFKAGISWILSEGRATGSLSTAELRKRAGLGVNIVQVYPDAKCYLKGIFNALEAFWGDRDSEGWRFNLSQDSVELLEYSLETKQESPLEAQGDYPLLTAVNPELMLHAKALALQILFSGDQPLMVPIRPTDKHKLRFFVGDASREGFGGATQLSDGTIFTREGLWEPDFAAGGSNLREAQNQVNHLLQEIRGGWHDGCKLWAATDGQPSGIRVCPLLVTFSTWY